MPEPLPAPQRWGNAPWKAAPTQGRRAPPARGRAGVVHFILFALTVVSTTVAGVGMAHRPAPMRMAVAWQALQFEPQRLWDGIMFSAPLLVTLFAHEMGHYLVARRWHVKASWPFFVPMPAGLGTMGALIAMDPEDEKDRRAMLEIGAAGPLAGFVPAFGFLLVGLHFSGIKTQEEMVTFIRLGGFDMPDSVALSLGTWLMKGSLAPGTQVVLHPMALAGWYGLYLTWFNLLPFGQLDGGHIAAATFPGRSRLFNVTVVGGLLLVALLTWRASWLGILVGLAVLGVLAGVSHPKPKEGSAPLGFRQQVVLWACLLVFLLCFVADPLPKGGL